MVLRGEIEGPGRPRAALVAMALALVAANALVVVKQALRLTHGEGEFAGLSDYYPADEEVGNDRAVDKLIAAAEWSESGSRPSPSFWEWCRDVGSRVKTDGFLEHTRGPSSRNRPAPRAEIVIMIRRIDFLSAKIRKR